MQTLTPASVFKTDLPVDGFAAEQEWVLLASQAVMDSRSKMCLAAPLDQASGNPIFSRMRPLDRKRGFNHVRVLDPVAVSEQLHQFLKLVLLPDTETRFVQARFCYSQCQIGAPESKFDQCHGNGCGGPHCPGMQNKFARCTLRMRCRCPGEGCVGYGCQKSECSGNVCHSKGCTPYCTGSCFPAPANRLSEYQGRKKAVALAEINEFILVVPIATHGMDAPDVVLLKKDSYVETLDRDSKLKGEFATWLHKSAVSSLKQVLKSEDRKAAIHALRWTLMDKK